MKKIIYILSLSLGIMFVSSCELDLQESPNVLTPEQADPDFLLNSIQIGTADFFYAVSDRGRGITRMVNLGGATWDGAFSPSSFNTMWTTAYSTILIDTKVVITLAEEKELYQHAGIAQILQGYVLMTLVDVFGDVPLSEALDPNNLAPAVDPAVDVYAAALASIEAGITNMGLTSLATPATDLYFDGDAAKWVTLANTLKLRMALQTRLINAGASASTIEALVTAGDLIDTDAEMFVFQYGTANAAPDSRHPDFAANYPSGATDYMSNYFMNKMYNDKSVVDPRMRYYFYRQVAEIPNDVTLLDCLSNSAPAHYSTSDIFCAFDPTTGYWGRDHLSNDGIPPDTQKRTVYGAYPIGGLYDNDQATLTGISSGMAGAGFEPMLMPWYTHFMLAESSLTLGTTGDPRVHLAAGVQGCMDYVINSFGGGAGSGAATEPTAAEITAYVNEVLANYDAATNDAQRLDVIMTEYYFALWGNGLDAYNNYRRTGYPSDMQPSVEVADAGAFYRSFTYPARAAERNSSIDQKESNAVQVFWDNNAPGFVD